MTGITRPILRISDSACFSRGKRRPVIVELSPPGQIVGFRLKGTRKTYYLPIDWCYREALRAEIARQKREKKKEKQK